LNKIRFGLIGMGRWSREVHIPNLKNIPAAEIVALSDIDQENLDIAAEKAGGNPATFHDYHDLLNSDNVDAVIVSVPNYLHKQFTIESLQAGKHVLCEKPLATTVDDHKAIQRELETTDRIVQVGFELRYAKFFKEIDVVIRDNTIGDIEMIWCHIYRGPVLSEWRLDDSKTGGLLLELCSHHFDLMSWYANSKVQAVFGLQKHAQPGELYEGAQVDIAFENNVTGSVVLTLFSDFDNEVKIGVLGSKGTLEASLKSNTISFFTRDNDEVRTIRPTSDTEIPEYGFAGARLQLESFIESIGNNSIPRSNPDSVFESLVIALGAQKSMQTGCMERRDTL